MSKQFRIVALLSVLLILLAGCRYECTTYTVAEVQQLFEDNYQLFNDVAQILHGDDDFFAEGRDRDDDTAAAILSSPHDKQMECFSTQNQKTLQKFFDLGPCRLCYYHDNDVVEIIFHGLNSDLTQNDMIFFCAMNPTNQKGLDDYLDKYSYIAYAKVDPLRNGWYFCTY